AFPKAFEGLVRDAYKDLFEVRGEDAWTLSRKDLTAYFGTTDKTSEVIGGRQAGVFQMFRALAGHEQTNDSGASKTAYKPKQSKAKTAAQKKSKGPIIDVPEARKADGKDRRKDMALTVTIEINLPANGTQETYDSISKSIRANLIEPDK